MNLFLHSIAPIFLFVHLITFVDRSTNIPTDSTIYRYALAIAAILASIYLSTIVSRKLDENKRSADKKLPPRFGPWYSFWYRLNTSKKNQSLLSEIRREYQRVHWGEYINVTEFDWYTIVASTINFCETRLVGRGGSGTTSFHKAVFPPSKEVVAVKRFTPYSRQGLNGFMNEILLVPKLEHPNMIKLHGYCIHKNEKLLVYEFMRLTSSLDSEIEPLFADSLDSEFKPMECSAVHMLDGLSVVHGDLKLSNILLDSKMNPKISGFASARSSRILSYMSPKSDVHMKSDIYSFGVIVLVMVTGKSIATDSDIMSLVDYASKVWIEGGALQLVDESINGRCIRVGLLCTLRKPEDRPLMTSVLKILQGDNGERWPQTDVLSRSGSDAEDSMYFYNLLMSVDEA